MQHTQPQNKTARKSSGRNWKKKKKNAADFETINGSDAPEE